MQQADTQVRAEATGRITSAPEFTRTMAGTALCRFKITAETGPASTPLVKSIYVWGLSDGEPDDRLADLAKRCGRNLQMGDRVFVPGTERQRNCGRGTEHAIIAEDVKLRERGGTTGGAA